MRSIVRSQLSGRLTSKLIFGAAASLGAIVWSDRPDDFTVCRQGLPDRPIRIDTLFLGGYGRPPSPAEDRLTWHLGALDALTALARGHENADPELVAIGRDTLRQLRKEA